MAKGPAALVARKGAEAVADAGQAGGVSAGDFFGVDQFVFREGEGVGDIARREVASTRGQENDGTRACRPCACGRAPSPPKWNSETVTHSPVAVKTVDDDDEKVIDEGHERGPIRDARSCPSRSVAAHEGKTGSARPASCEGSSQSGHD